MSDVMLHGVLNMPPEMWQDSDLDNAQRFSRYQAASRRILDDEREIARLRAEVEALREDAAKCRAELLAIHEIASCGWSNVLQHPIAPADTLTVRDVKIMAIELLKGHQTAEPRDLRRPRRVRAQAQGGDVMAD